MNNCITAIALSLLFFIGCSGSPSIPDDPYALVELLVDTGEEPTPPEVHAASKKIAEMGILAYPALMESIDDQRLAWKNFVFQEYPPTIPTLGKVCFSKIQYQVEYHANSKGGTGFITKNNIRDWWEKSKGKNLTQLQIEHLEWYIAKIQNDNSDTDEYKQKRLSLLKQKLTELKG